MVEERRVILLLAVAKNDDREIRKALKDFEMLPDSQKNSAENIPLLKVAQSLKTENAQKNRILFKYQFIYSMQIM